MSQSDLTLNDTEGCIQYAWLEICTYPRECVGWWGFLLSERSSCLFILYNVIRKPGQGRIGKVLHSIIPIFIILIFLLESRTNTHCQVLKGTPS